MSFALKAKTESEQELPQSFQPNISFSLQKNDYVLKTIDSLEELYQSFRLRAEVFLEQSHSQVAQEYDYDRFDHSCDHIVIYNEKVKRMVGTYRVRSTKFHSEFYSAQEFDINPILQLPGNKMELGRACVQKEFRNGTIISLLWRGIAKYSFRTQSQFLFGCSSVFTMDPQEAAQIYLYLKNEGHLDSSLQTQPTFKYKIKKFKKILQALQENNQANLAMNDSLPTLFATYLKMGAVVCGEPALDKDFKCIDFLTVLELTKLSQLFRKFQE